MNGVKDNNIKQSGPTSWLGNISELGNNLTVRAYDFKHSNYLFSYKHYAKTLLIQLPLIPISSLKLKTVI